MSSPEDYPDPNSAVWRCLGRALDAMNHAVQMTADDGPAKAVEYVADFLNDTDSIDPDIADTTPQDWLTRWTVKRA